MGLNKRNDTVGISVRPKYRAISLVQSAIERTNSDSGGRISHLDGVGSAGAREILGADWITIFMCLLVT